MSEQFCDVGRGITLCYETFGKGDRPPLVLIMGLATQMIAWPERFCEQLAARGFYVVRFDNRDSGHSTHIGGPPPAASQIVRRRIDPVLYTLGDMADDTAGLLRELELEPAHVVGVSMGGMIGQTLAARHPQSIRSLVSIMSSTGNRWKGQPGISVMRYLLRRAPAEREAFIEHTVRVYKTIGSPGFTQNLDRVREVAARSHERSLDPAGSGRQLGAVLASGDRTRELGQIAAPTLVIHGSRDRMINRSGGRATARAIPGARLMMVEGMGHDLPEGAWPLLIDAITRHAQDADQAGVADASRALS